MDFKIQLYKNEGIKELSNNIFPPHFLLAIIGKPGSGKTSLLKHILKSDKFLFKKFNKVFIISPSEYEFKQLFLPKENFYNKLDIGWINNKIEQVKKECEQEYKNILFIFDDVIAMLDSLKNNEEILSFIFNRRHKLNDKGMISVMVTAQKFNKLPTAVRANLTELIFFKLNSIDYKTIFEDVIYDEKKKYEDVISLLNKTSQYSNFIIYRIDINKFYYNFDEITID